MWLIDNCLIVHENEQVLNVYILANCFSITNVHS